MSTPHPPLLPGRCAALLAFACELSSNLHYLWLTGAPAAVYGHYLGGLLAWRSRQRFLPRRQAFQDRMATLSFSNDWFTTRIPYWLAVFERENLAARPLNILEIGSWEGASSLFFLEQLPQARLTCVDTWAGADEHQGQKVLNSIESNFDHNLSAHSGRLTKFKDTSFNYFVQTSGNAQADFDLVYIDGSHHADDVMVDAVKAFERLRTGGLMIFDDYFWRLYNRDTDNPAVAINSFLRMKKGQCEIVSVYYQIIIRKTSGRARIAS